MVFFFHVGMEGVKPHAETLNLILSLANMSGYVLHQGCTERLLVIVLRINKNIFFLLVLIISYLTRMFYFEK